ncbi:hypothetical protein ACUXOC_001105 [Corynebacterium mucifaciens]
MASHKAQRQQRAAAKKKRRAARLKKRPQEDFTPIPLPETPAPAPAAPSLLRSTVDTTCKNVEDFLPFPVWKYKEKAEEAAADDPTRSPEDILDDWMNTLVRIHHLGNTSYGGFIPAQLDKDGDLPKHATADLMAELSTIGFIRWNPATRAHVLTMPTG